MLVIEVLHVYELNAKEFLLTTSTCHLVKVKIEDTF